MRGWGVGKMIFEGLAPENLPWFEVGLTQSELRPARLHGWGWMEEWDALAEPRRLVGDAANRVLDGTARSEPSKLENLRAIAGEVDSARQPPKKLILVSDAHNSVNRVLIEGCHRATGYCMATTPPQSFPVFIGVGPEVTDWGRW